MKRIFFWTLGLCFAASPMVQAEFVVDFVGSDNLSWIDVGSGSQAVWNTASPANIYSYYDRFIAQPAAFVTNAPFFVGDQFRLSGTYQLHPSSALGQLFFLPPIGSVFGFALSNDDDAGFDLIRLWYGNGGPPSVIGLVGVDIGDTFDFDVDGFGIASLDYDVFFALGAGGTLSMSGTIIDGSGPRYTFSTNFVISALASPPGDLHAFIIASDMISTDDNTQGPPQLIADPISRLQWGYSAIPEPSLLLMFGTGSLLVCFFRRQGRCRRAAGQC